MINRISKILIVMNKEFTIIRRLKGALIFAILYFVVIIYLFASQIGDMYFLFLKNSPIFITLLTFIIFGVIYGSRRYNQRERVYSMESLLTTPLTISQIIFGKSLGVILISAISAVITNFFLIIVVILKSKMLPLSFFWISPISIIYCSLLFFLLTNLMIVLQILIGGGEGSRIAFFVYLGLGFLVISVLEDHPDLILFLILILTIVIFLLIGVQYYIFNKILSKQVLIKE